MEKLNRARQNAPSAESEAVLDSNERNVHELMLLGWGNKKIADALKIARNEVKRVRKSVDEKLGLPKGS